MSHRSGRARGFWPTDLALPLAAVVAFATTAAAMPRISAPLAMDAQGQAPLRGAPAGVIAFVNVHVIPMDTERVLTNQTVLIQGGWISAMGPASQIKIPNGAERIDGNGQYLIPGLAEMHGHVNQAAWGTLPSGLTYDSLEAERRLFLWLAQGITTVRNMTFLDVGDAPAIRLNGRTMLQLRARAAAGKILSPRIYTAGSWTKRPRDAFPPLDSVAAYVAAYKVEGYDFLKVHDEPGTVLDSVLAAARRVKMPVAGHVYDPGQALSGGVRSVEHLKYFQGIGRDTARLRALALATARADVWNCPTVLLNRVNEGELAVVKALQEAGAGLLLGTDAPVVPDPDNPSPLHGDQGVVHRELEVLVRAGLTPYQALVTGTRNVAVYFGTLDSTGTITVGKRADLVLLRGNPLRDIKNTAGVAGVMIGGGWLDRATLDRQLAALTPSQQRERYWRYVYDAKRVLLAIPQALRQQFEPVHVSQQQALLDSLQSSADSLTGHPRLIALLARQLGAVRTALSSEEQAKFDPAVRAWRTKRVAEGYRTVIPADSP